MTIKYRPATDAELAEYIAACPRRLVRHDGTETGATPRKYRRMRCHVMDGVPKVASGQYKGERLAGSYGIMPSGREVIHDLRLAYLPSRHCERNHVEEPTKYRPATEAEVSEYLRRGLRARFRHYPVKEQDRRTQSGVRHRQYTTARCDVIAGIPKVVGGRYRGERLSATIATCNGAEIFLDLRIAALPARQLQERP